MGCTRTTRIPIEMGTMEELREGAGTAMPGLTFKDVGEEYQRQH
jgi:hypothetical protein